MLNKITSAISASKTKQSTSYSSKLDCEILMLSRDSHLTNESVTISNDKCLGLKIGTYKLNELLSSLAHAKVVDEEAGTAIEKPMHHFISIITKAIEEDARQSSALNKAYPKHKIVGLQNCYRALRSKSISSDKCDKLISFTTDIDFFEKGNYSYLIVMSEIANLVHGMYQKETREMMGSFPRLLH